MRWILSLISLWHWSPSVIRDLCFNTSIGHYFHWCLRNINDWLMCTDLHTSQKAKIFTWNLHVYIHRGYLGSYSFDFVFVLPIYTITNQSSTRCSPVSASHWEGEQKSPIITSTSGQINWLLYWGSCCSRILLIPLSLKLLPGMK